MNREFGRLIVETHLGEMNAESRKPQVPIVEVDGFRIVQDAPYQGFDAGPGVFPSHPWWTEARFWCRAITVQNIATGKLGVGRGPQAEAYAAAVKAASE